MASPQLEDGYTKIANEIFEQLGKLYMRSNQWQVLQIVFRKVYGFNKKQDYLTNSQIVDGTGLSKEVVSRSISDMVERNILTRDGKVVGFQKDWEKWKLPEQSTNKSCLNSQLELPKQSTKVDGSLVTQKKKETITKEIVVSGLPLEMKEKESFPPYPLIKKEKAKLPLRKKQVKKEFFSDLPGILLSKEEYDKLILRYGPAETRSKCEALFLYMGSHGKKYASHYLTILNWDREEKKRQPKQEEKNTAKDCTEGLWQG